MSIYRSTEDIEHTLSLLGTMGLDLSSQPQTPRGITKKLMQLTKDIESIEHTVVEEESEVTKEIARVKKDIPEWVFDVNHVGDGRRASSEEKEEAGLVLDELEAYINSASNEALLDMHAAVMQSLVISSEQHYKLNKLDDYRRHLDTTRLVSQSTHRNLCALGIGMESSLPDITMLTETPSMVNYHRISGALEAKQSILRTILGLLASIGIGVVVTIAVNYAVRFAYYLIDVIERKIKSWRNKDKTVKRNKRQVPGQGTLYKNETPTRSPKAEEVFKYASEEVKSMEQIAIGLLYADTANGRLKQSNLDDLYAVGTPENLDGLKSLWQTMQNVLSSVDASLVELTKAVETMTTTATVDDPAIDPAVLEESLVIANTVEQSFKKYDNPKIDTLTGLNIIESVAKIYGKGDLATFEKRLQLVKKHLAELDTTIKRKKDTGETSDEIQAFFVKRLYLLRAATEYLSSNVKLQARFQRLAISHAQLFSENMQAIQELDDELKNSKPDEPGTDGAIPA